MLLAASSATMAVELPLKPVLQLGHDQPPLLAAWLPDGRHLASAADNDLIVWDSDTGHIISQQYLPRDADAQIVPISVTADDASVRMRLTADRPKPDSALRLITCETWSFDPTALAAPALVANDTGACPGEAVASQRAANGRSWRINRDRIEILPGADGRPVVPLINLPRRQYTGGAVSPDARFVAQIAVAQAGDAKVTRVSARSLRQGTVFPERQFDGDYQRLLWLDEGHYVLSPWPISIAKPCAGGPLADTLIVKADSGQIERVPTLPQLMLLGTEGGMIGIGPVPCKETQVWKPDTLAIRKPGQGWQPLALAATRDREIFKVAARPDGSAIALMTAEPNSTRTNTPRQARAVIVHLRDGQPVDELTLPLRFDGAPYYVNNGSNVWGFGIGRDGKLLLIGIDNHVLCFDTQTGQQIGKQIELDGDVDAPDFYSTADGLLVVGLQRQSRFEVFNLSDATKSEIPADRLNAAGVLGSRNLLWSIDVEGTTRFYDQRTRNLVLTSFALPNDGILTIDADGRYDTNQGADTATIRWQVSNQPFDSLPPQMFMKDRYEPDLLPRRLDCTTAGSCGKVFKPLPPMVAINQAVPSASIARVAPGPRPRTVRVTVEARQGRAADGTLSGLSEVRVLRDGRLVATLAGAEEKAADSSGILRRDIEIAVPSRSAPVEFTAYAFNSDRRKGETSDPVRFSPSPRDRLRRAYILTIGIDRYAITGRDLNYAAADARALAARLNRIDGYKVHALTLTSDASGNRATKSLLRASFGLLTGAPGNWASILRDAGIDVRDFGPATPDDIVIISWSGHGQIIQDFDPAARADVESFALVPSDLRQSDRFAEIDTASLITAGELADWLRPLDAGDVAFIIDACHSSASVTANGFKPGPMGDRTLGQLAFDKGLRILAATQADNVAREEASRGLGLLTATLIDAGLGGAALGTQDGWIRLDSVLRQTASALPERLLAELAARDAKDPPPLLLPYEPVPPPPVQVPAVFDFTGKASQAWIATKRP